MILRFLSQLLKSAWLFFPGILFLLLPVFFFWELGQGKDIIVAFIDGKPSRILFFVAIAFWVYVSWYSSRIISYIKKKQQLDLLNYAGIDKTAAENNFKQQKNFFEIDGNFLDEFPRIIGNSCFLILELAVLQSPALYTSISSVTAWIILFIALIIIWWINRIIMRKLGKMLADTVIDSKRTKFKKSFWILLAAFVLLVLITGFFSLHALQIWLLFAMLLLFHVVFLFYINLRRADMEKNAETTRYREAHRSYGPLKKSMDLFCIPIKEIGYYRWFLAISAVGLTLYLIAIFSPGFARHMGPFPFIILAFGVLLIFGNIVTAFSVRYRVNFHFLLLLLALFFGLGETHEVRTIHLENNGYAARPDLKTYLKAWMANKDLKSDTCYDMYFVMSNGGASRSGYWTAAVLGKIEDASLIKHPADRFSDHVFCLSGTSGGGVGVAAFFSLLRDKSQQTKPMYAKSAQAFLKQDYFTYTFARLLGPDFFNYIFHFSTTGDRAAALESSFEESSRKTPDSVYMVPFADPLSSFPAMQRGKVTLPILFVNTTRMQDGNPGVVTNLNINSSKDVFNRRIDVVSLLGSDKDISITSGAILGARFPYLSPAGRIADNYFVDGGYFDNSGAGAVQEIIRGILKIAQDDSSLKEQVRRLNFKILHIVNSPVGFESTEMKSVAPFKNDVLSPVLTIVGAYGMQTTVNDGRLTNYIKDIDQYGSNNASYAQISLYESPLEWQKDTVLNRRFKNGEPPYAMNWFMSDTTARRIDKRLGYSNTLNSIISNFDKKVPIKRLAAYP